MAQFIIEDLDEAVIERLEVLAKEHGRSLQAELKHILETAVSASPSLSRDETTLQQAEKMRQQIARHAGMDISKLPPIDREKALHQLAKMRASRKILPGGMSIREMREEGRRF